MCGICGFVVPGGSRGRERLIREVDGMAATLTHRGPDGAGHWVDPERGLALGHRRLAVIDPSEDGAQPMTSSCGRWVLVYNGEIYNFRELRAELESAGRRLRGRSDTEVLVEALGAWGAEGALARCRGMYAFAAWDRREGRLHLARDPVGKKPLYHAQRGGLLWFGSELKALRAHPDFQASIDRESLAFLVRFSYVPAPHTIYSDVAKLEAGEHRSFPVGADGGPGVGPATRRQSASLGEWAAAGEREPFAGSPEEAVDALHGLLGRAVTRRLVADVPLGALLSGGIDSSVVVAAMQHHGSRAARTFTIGYRETRHDEADHARRIAEHLGTEHTELVVTPEQAREVIPRLPTLYDEPFADTSQLPTALVCALARRHVTVALSGDGGDELFAGYPRYARCLGRGRALAALPSAWRRRLAAAARTVAPARGARLAEALEAGGSDALFVAAGARHPARVPFVVGARGAPRGPQVGWPELADPLARLTTLDLTGRLPESILVKVDRASMGVGLEVRSPLLDAELVAFALRLPAALRVREGRAKWPLRQLLARSVPPALFERPKQGFGVPIGEWLRGPLREWGEDLLAPGRLEQQGWLRAGAVRRVWQEHQRRTVDHRFLLWNLLVFQAWLAAGA